MLIKHGEFIGRKLSTIQPTVSFHVSTIAGDISSKLGLWSISKLAQIERLNFGSRPISRENHGWELISPELINSYNILAEKPSVARGKKS